MLEDRLRQSMLSDCNLEHLAAAADDTTYIFSENTSHGGQT